MNSQLIPSFRQDGLSVRELYLFRSGDHAALLQPELGVTLFLRHELAEQILSRSMSESLSFLLVQRGMADYDQSRAPAKLDRTGTPYFFLIDLTDGCNLCCKYCFRDVKKAPHTMSEANLKIVCAELAAYWKRHPEIRLSIQPWGGEPLICFPLIEKIREYFDCEGLDPEMVVETNGTLIDEKAAAVLRKLRVNIGMSIDGIPQVHDAQRPDAAGRPSSPRVVRGMNALLAAGYTDFGAITVVTRNTIEHLHETLDYYANTLNLRSVKLNPMRETDKKVEFAPDPEMLREFVQRLLDEMIALHKRGSGMVEQNISQRLKNLMLRDCGNICNSHSCQGGYAMLTVDYDAKVYPCEMSDYSEMSIGTLGEKPIEAMVAEAARAKTGYYAPRDRERCGQCPWRFYCGGGCKAAAFFATGSTRNIDEAECLINRTLYPLLTELLMTDPEMAVSLMNGAVYHG